MLKLLPKWLEISIYLQKLDRDQAALFRMSNITWPTALKGKKGVKVFENFALGHRGLCT